MPRRALLSSGLGAARPRPGAGADLGPTEVTERYRGLRAAVEAVGARDPEVADVVTLLVVGVDRPAAEVGVRLAASFAAAEQRTLLVETDVARPGCPRYLGDAAADPAAGPGLAEWLAGPADAPHPSYPTDLPRLAFLPAGRARGDGDPLPADRLAALFTTARAERDRVVVVAAPLSASADALLLARHVDGVLLVVVPGKTEGPQAVRARDALRHAGGRVLGVVLDDPPAR